jgi:signal transduction histidine kinase
MDIGLADRRLAAVLFAGMAAVLVAMSVSTIPGVRAEPGLDPLYDTWLQCLGYVLAAVAVTWRAARRAEQRRLWSLVAAALVLRAYGFVHTFFVLDRAPVYPSLADVAWVLSAVALLASLLVVVREHAPRFSRTLTLDALLGAVTAAAIFFAVLVGTLERLTQPGTPVDVVVTNLAYPLLDVTILVVMAGLVAVTHGRLPWSVVTLCLGLLLFAAVDTAFLYQVTAGTFRPGSVLTPLSLTGTMLIALAAWLPVRTRPKPPLSRRNLLAPVALTLLCVATLAYDAVEPVPAIGVLLASAGVVIAIVRTALTFTVDQREASDAIAAKDAELEQFMALVEATDDFVALATTQGRVTYVNPGGRRLVGVPADFDVTACTVDDFVAGDPDPRVDDGPMPRLRRLVATGATSRGEQRLRDWHGGDPIPVVSSTFVIPHPGTDEPWLVATVQRDISERLAAEHALGRLADERQQLLGRLVQAENSERSRIAADVHDDSVQALAAVDLRLGLLRRRLEATAPEALADVDALRETVGGATERLRNLLFDLESAAESVDLVTALSEAAAFVLGDAVSWRIEHDEGVDLPAASRVTAYRAAKEAMTNALKHAAASEVVIEARYVDEGVAVCIADDGRGLAADATLRRPGHRGIAHHRDRATVAGGWLRLEERPGGGTVVRVWLPTPDALEISRTVPDQV